MKNVDGLDVYNFEGWTYRPAIELCNSLFDSGKAIWNTGYFVTSVKFVIERYRQHLPEMAEKLEEIIENPELMDEIYPTLESISFDDGIVVKTNKNQAVVLKVDMGWSDPGSLYALKEALVSNTDDNFVKGRAITLDLSLIHI